MTLEITNTILRVCIIIATGVATSLLVYIAIRRPADRLHSLTMAFGAANILAFHIVRLLKLPIDVPVLNSWSMSIYLYISVITLINAYLSFNWWKVRENHEHGHP